MKYNTPDIILREVAMKTKFALAFYCLAIGLLTACAIVIVAKLIFWPPCTKTGNTCAIDPWTTAGLAGTVLAVAATVLAVLGAVSVAAWWTSLNTRVTDQVNDLYEDHKKEIRKNLADFLSQQQQVVSDQLGTVQTKLQTVERRIDDATRDINELEAATHDFEEIVVDGIMIIEPWKLEEWARKAIANHKFSKVPAKMTEGYLGSVERGLAQAEDEMTNSKDKLHYAEQIYQEWATAPDQPVSNLLDIYRHYYQQLSEWSAGSTKTYLTTNRVLAYWEGALRWLATVKDETADKETLRPLEEKLEKYRPRVVQLQQDYDQSREMTQVFLQQMTPFLEKKGIVGIYLSS